MNSELQSALAACKTLPTLPTVAAQIIELSSQEDYGLMDIIEIVRNDISIATKLIASANTPQYYRGEAVVDISQAVSRLGFKSTMMIALSFSLSVKSSDSPPANIDTDALWHRSVASGAIARLLARQLGSKDPEACFLAALVQDIGVLALAQAAPQAYATLADSSHEALCAAEVAEFGCDHAVVGAWLLESWKLPSQISELVASSHDFAELTLEIGARQDHWCVAVSGLLADAMLAGDQFQAARMVWLINGVCDEDGGTGTNIVPLVAEAVREAEGLFDATLVKDPMALLEASKEKLFEVMSEASRDISDEKVSELEQRVSMLERQGQRDSLTGAINRGHFHSELDRLFDEATQSGQPLSLMFIDADHFKQVNDSYGHLAGDEVLKWLAEAFTKLVGDKGIVGRYGGEEFVVILPASTEAEANALGQTICDHVRNGHISAGDANIQVTVSAGIATIDKTSTLRGTRDLIFAADQAMYFAKQSGRDLCISASALPKPPSALATAQ
ncbi:sensor domain-containing diguanylate cyclase [Congregibacter litoralis]|uniref:diguanylate cyclase n=1 Tax=Congregibacter litoralis KT71 TaxID=314285 RepID=A4A4X4_9GAMM|nr:GGDEF domain-containing protein [Congregibacter litoralis]EAQ98845.1 diguanylate cyclase (GGDEF) domain protein [Congregibacter litoralis KT71]